MPLGEVLLVTGTIGSGKTTVATEMCAVLGELGIAAAAVDLDWLGWTSLPPPGGVDGFITENLRALMPNFEAAGITRLVLTRAVRKAAQVDALRAVVTDARLRVALLDASREVIESRLRARDRGVDLERHLIESREFEQIESDLADFGVSNDDRAPREVAEEVLRRAAWIQ